MNTINMHLNGTSIFYLADPDPDQARLACESAGAGVRADTPRIISAERLAKIRAARGRLRHLQSGGSEALLRDRHEESTREG